VVASPLEDFLAALLLASPLVGRGAATSIASKCFSCLLTLGRIGAKWNFGPIGESLERETQDQKLLWLSSMDPGNPSLPGGPQSNPDLFRHYITARNLFQGTLTMSHIIHIWVGLAFNLLSISFCPALAMSCYRLTGFEGFRPSSWECHPRRCRS